jgi:arylsulfatase
LSSSGAGRDGGPDGRKDLEGAMRELATPRVINLIKDPQEREPVSLPYMHSWTIGHFNRILTEFRESVVHEL